MLNRGLKPSVEPARSTNPGKLLWRRSSLTKVLLVGLVLAMLSAPGPVRGAASADDDTMIDRSSEVTPWQDMGWGLGSVVTTLFYSPLKIVYAGLGLVTSGFGYVLSAGNARVASNILDPAIGGDYIVTPGHLKGEKKLAFMGARRYP